MLFCRACVVLCALAGAAQAGTPLTLALGTEGLGAAPLVVAKAGRHFAQAGLELTLAQARSDLDAAQAVADGRASFGTAEMSAAFLSFAASHNLRIVAPEYSDRTGFPSTALVVTQAARQSGLRIQTLGHRRIGLLQTDSPSRFALVAASARYAVPADTIRLIPAENEARLQADLLGGRLDAALIPYEAALGWRNQRPDLSIVRLSDFVQWQDAVIFTRAAMLREQPDVVASFLGAYRAASADYDLTFQQRDDEGTALPGSHFGSYLLAVAAQAGVPPRQAAYALPYCDRRAQLDVADLQNQLAFWQSLGLVPHEVTIDRITDGAETPWPAKAQPPG